MKHNKLNEDPKYGFGGAVAGQKQLRALFEQIRKAVEEGKASDLEDTPSSHTKVLEPISLADMPADDLTIRRSAVALGINPARQVGLRFSEASADGPASAIVEASDPEGGEGYSLFTVTARTQRRKGILASVLGLKKVVYDGAVYDSAKDRVDSSVLDSEPNPGAPTQSGGADADPGVVAQGKDRAAREMPGGLNSDELVDPVHSTIEAFPKLAPEEATALGALVAKVAGLQHDL